MAVKNAAWQSESLITEARIIANSLSNAEAGGPRRRSGYFLL